MNSAKQKSKIAFNQQAPTYDCDIKGQHARTLYLVIINRLKSISYQTALDLGCGTGEVMKLILQQDNSKILYGLDLSEKMLEIAQKKLENRATLILGDSEQLPFSDCFFDVVYCNDSFHHYPAPERVLSEIDRVSDGELRETQMTNYFSNLYPIDCAVLSVNAQSYRKYGTLPEHEFLPEI